MRPIASVATAATLAAAIMVAFMQPSETAEVEIKEWDVPWENTRPRDPWVGDQRIWFVGQRGDYVASLDPTSGSFRRYDLDGGTGPHTVIADKRGAWYAGNRAGHIGLVHPETGAIEKIPLPGDGPRDVHTMDFTSDDDIWFTVQGGNKIGLMEAGSRDVTLFEVPTPNARPYGLIVGADDRPWATLFGTNKLATVADGAVREIELPREDARPRRLAITDDGRVWYVDYAEGYVGRFDPKTDAFKEWRTPAAGNARPYAMTADDRGRLWFVETGPQPNRLVGFDPASESFIGPIEIPSGGGTVRHMVYDPETRSIWFGTDTNTVGRARLG